jgi:uncharacterized protein (DUF1697 family)
MHTYVILLRGINVGGKNKISMSELTTRLEEMGFSNVRTLINSGNVVLKSQLSKAATIAKIEDMLPKKFTLDSSIIRICALDQKTYKKVVDQAPKEFGTDNEKYRYYVLFLMGVSSSEAMEQIEAKEGVDTAWKGDHAIYFRLPSIKSPDATKSHLNKIIQKPIYKAVTMRNWNTTTKLLNMLEEK